MSNAIVSCQDRKKGVSQPMESNLQYVLRRSCSEIHHDALLCLEDGSQEQSRPRAEFLLISMESSTCRNDMQHKTIH